MRKNVLPFWEEELFNQSPFLMKKLQLLKKWGLFPFSFLGMLFQKPPLALTNYAIRSIWRVRRKSSFMTLESSHSKLKVSVQYYSPPLNICLYTRSWVKSISGRLFNSEFKSFYDSAIQSIKLGIGRRTKKAVSFFIFNKYTNVEESFCIFGGFPIRQNWMKRTLPLIYRQQTRKTSHMQ